MYAELQGQVVVITGAGAGIGRATAQRFAQEGASVVVNDLRAEAANETAEELRAGGHQVVAVTGDMTDAGTVASLFDQAMERFGRVDILVNNVGLFTFSDILSDDLSEWEACIAINLTSAYLASRRAAIEMRRAGSGCIVNISSGAGKVGSTSAGGYGAAKAGVLGLTRSLAAELAPVIRVNAVCPGLVETAMDEGFSHRAAQHRGIGVAAFKAERLQAIPLKRLARPVDVANAVAFLASDQAAYTTGEALNVSGGLVML